MNRETNCVCSGNLNHDECDNTLTTATVAKGFYTNHEDCDLEWSETVELAVPYFQTEGIYKHVFGVGDPTEDEAHQARRTCTRFWSIRLSHTTRLKKWTRFWRGTT